MQSSTIYKSLIETQGMNLLTLYDCQRARRYGPGSQPLDLVASIQKLS